MTTDPREMTTEQLNAEAAKGVMGWVIRNHRGPDDEYVSAWHSDDGHQGGRSCEDWSPATSIADAWELVEKMRASGWFYTVEDFIETNEHMAKFDSPFFPPGGPVVEIHHIDKTAPRAITIAAILAKREEKNGHL